MNLYENQSNALREIIAHATGTGKSLTGINIIYEFVKKYSDYNLF